MTKKRYCWFVAFVFAFCFGLVACAGDPTDNSGTGAEVGEYYYETAESLEYLLTLEEDGSASLSIGQNLTGTYTLNGSNLTLTLGEKIIDAEYSETSIFLTYDGKELEFLKKIYFTVTFETNGGTKIESEQVLNGKKVVKPETEPQKMNGKFIGWYKDNGGNEPFDFMTEKITSNTTIYAKWDTVNTLTYDSESGLNGSVSVTDGKKFTLQVPVAEENYLFVGWFTENGNQGEQLTDATGESLVAWDSSEYGNITVYARFEMDLTYEETLDGRGYIVEGKAETADATVLDIPAMHNGKPVTEVHGFDGYTALISVYMPNSVTYIEELAFGDSPLLSSFEIYDVETEAPAFTSDDGVIFSDDGSTLLLFPVAKAGNNGIYEVPVGVTKIAPRAFYDVLTGYEYDPTYSGVLQEVIFPASLAEVGDYAFYARGNLRTISFTDGGNAALKFGDYAFAQTSLTSFEFPDNLIEIGDYAFYADYIATPDLPGKLSLPNGLLSIGAHAFEGASWLESLIVPASVSSIGEYAFAVYSLQSIELRCRITSIPSGMLSGTRITEFVIPNEVVNIGDSAFENCSSIVSLTLPQGLESIGDKAFASMRSLETINIPSTVVSFGTDVFSDCDNLRLDNVTIGEGCKAVVIDGGVLYSGDKKTLLYYPATNTQSEYVMPDEVENIPSDLFNYHDYVTTVVLSSNLKKIPSGAFYGSKITSIKIPASVTEIEKEAFAYIRSFTTVEFETGGALEIIGADAFKNCSNLSGTVILPEGLQEIGSFAFSGTGISGVTLPQSLIKIGEQAFSKAKLTDIVLPGNLRSIGVQAFSSNQLISVTVENGVTSLPSNCFAKNAFLTSVRLPASLEEIGDGAFSECTSLSSISLPERLLHLGVGVFSGSSSLNTIQISTENDVYAAVDGNLYDNKVTTLLQYAVGKSETEFTLPDSVKVIGSQAFSGCKNLAVVDLNNVKTIEDSAFVNCTALTTLYGIENVTSIGNNVFQACVSLAHIDLDKVASMGTGVFSGSGLVSVKNWNLKSVPAETFYSCSDLLKIDLLDVVAIGNSAFYGCTALSSVCLGDSLVSLGENCFRNCSALTSIRIPGGVKVISQFAFSGTGLTDVEIEEGVELIESWAFSGVFGLKEIAFPASVKTIASGAFERCKGLEKVILPAGLETFNWQSFDRADHIKEWVIDESNTNYKTIDGNLYSKDGTVLIRYAVGKDATVFTVLQEVTTIGAYAFYSYYNLYDPDTSFNYEQKLEEIVFGENVKTIESNAFLNCKNIKRVTISTQSVLDTLAQIVIGSEMEDWVTTDICLFDAAEEVTIKDGLVIPSAITENYTPGESENGYTTYIKNSVV